MDSSGTMSRFLMVWNPLEQTSSVILVQATPGMDFGTHGISSGSHICINASDDTIRSSSPVVASGPLPGMVIWSSMSGTSELALPTYYARINPNKPKFGLT